MWGKIEGRSIHTDVLDVTASSLLFLFTRLSFFFFFF